MLHPILSTLIALMLSLTVLVAPSMAQEEAWFAYLLNITNSAELIRVNSDGTKTNIDLGLESAAGFGVNDMAFNDDGKLTAFVAADYNVNPPNFTLIVRDLEAATNLLEQPIEGAWAARVSREAFNEDASQVAVGVLNYIAGDPNADTTKPAWVLTVYDVATGEQVNEITAQSELIAGTEIADNGFMPDVRRFEDGVISFAAIVWFSEGVAENPAFAWDVAANTLTEAPLYGYSFADRIETADGTKLAYTDLDESQPNAEPGGPLPLTNVVREINANGEETTLYTNTEELPVYPRYINDGNTLAVYLVQGFNFDNPEDPQEARWVAINPDGSVIDLTEPLIGSHTVTNAPGGYLYLTAVMQENMEDITTTLYYGSIGGEQREIWSNTGASMNSMYDVAFVSQ